MDTVHFSKLVRFGGEYFQLRIDTHFLFSWIFMKVKHCGSFYLINHLNNNPPLISDSRLLIVGLCHFMGFADNDKKKRYILLGNTEQLLSIMPGFRSSSDLRSCVNGPTV